MNGLPAIKLLCSSDDIWTSVLKRNAISFFGPGKERRFERSQGSLTEIRYRVEFHKTEFQLMKCIYEKDDQETAWLIATLPNEPVGNVFLLTLFGALVTSKIAEHQISPKIDELNVTGIVEQFISGIKVRLKSNSLHPAVATMDAVPNLISFKQTNSDSSPGFQLLLVNALCAESSSYKTKGWLVKGRLYKHVI